MHHLLHTHNLRSVLCSMNNFDQPFCNCSNTVYSGRACDKTANEETALNKGREDKQQAVDKSGKAKDKLEKDKAKCTDSTKKMLCPPSVAVPAAMRTACVGAMTECFVNDGVFDAIALDAYKTSKKDACPTEGEKYCDQEGICVGKGASCAPATKCPLALSFRCPSWGCAVDVEGCDSASKPEACPAGQQRCPDALCYPGTGGMKECAKAGVNWKGCPPGFIECTNGKAGTCGTDAADCEAKVGCAANLVFCGYLRDASGKPTMSITTGKPIANCVEEAKCTTGRDRPPKDTTKPLDPRTAGRLEALSADGKKAMVLRMEEGSFNVGGNAQAVNFSVASVPDSLMQEGAFGLLFDSGALMASLIQIEPSAEVEILGGMILDIPLLDEQANLDPALCALVLKNTQMLSISDITNVTGVLTSMGVCGKGEIGGCSCAVSVTHFSTYGVVDSSVAYDERVVMIANNTNTTEPQELSDAGAMTSCNLLETSMLTTLVTLVVGLRV
mmetsp:Transcript_95019/g.153267  ORF Transcript_95019/g.153267 Transcript_95019/m.153267 type:complete len:501 (+) Transcript_95019:142-1644(+)